MFPGLGDGVHSGRRHNPPVVLLQAKYVGVMSPASVRWYEATQLVWLLLHVSMQKDPLSQKCDQHCSEIDGGTKMARRTSRHVVFIIKIFCTVRYSFKNFYK